VVCLTFHQEKWPVKLLWRTVLFLAYDRNLKQSLILKVRSSSGSASLRAFLIQIRCKGSACFTLWAALHPKKTVSSTHCTGAGCLCIMQIHHEDIFVTIFVKYSILWTQLKILCEYVRFENLTAVTTKHFIFWNVQPCSLVQVYRRLGKPACCLVASIALRPWILRQNVPPKRQ
jgi:hypothetical protein